MQPDKDLGDEVARVKALLDNAKRLGLTWQLTLATVTDISPALEGVLDGDTEHIGLISLTGLHLIGDRVYVIQVPPSGNYIVGMPDPPGARLIGANPCRAISAQTVPSATPTVVSWDTASFDPYNYIGTLPTTNIVVPKNMDGVHSITVGLNITASGPRNFITIFRGANRVVRSSFDPNEDFVGATAVIYLVGGDIITVDAFQNSGGNASMIGCLEIYRLTRT